MGNKKIVRVLSAAVLLHISLLNTQSAQALFGVGDIVSDPGAYAYYAEQLTEAAKQTQQLKQQFENLKQQLEQQTLMTEGYGPQEWDDITDSFMELTEIANQGEAISYAMDNYDSKFRQTYPGYEAPDDYGTQYHDWSQTTLDSIRNSLGSAGLQYNEFSSESAKMQSLAHLSQSAKGQTQAIQAGNMIAGHLVTQIQKLRQLTMAQLQSQNAFMAHQINQEAASRAALDKIIHEIKPTEEHIGY